MEDRLMPTSPSLVPATLLIAGTRAGEPLDGPRIRAAGRIILVEPEERRAAALTRQAHGDPRITLHRAALGAEDGPGVLHVMNFAGMSSLRPASPALQRLLPGLRETARQEVRRLSVARLLADAGEIARPLHVVIDSPGSELDILEGFRAAGALGLIDQLELHCGTEAFQEGAADCATLERWVQKAGLIVQERDLRDPDWPLLRLRPRPGPSASLLQAEAHALRSAWMQQAEELASLRRRDEALRAELAARAQAQQAEAAQAAEALAARDQTLAEVQAQAQAQAQALHQRLNAAEAEAGALRARTAEAVELARKDVALAMRSQLLAQNDLRDLQRRHAETQTLCQRQEALLRQLTPRLQEAADHLRAQIPPRPADERALPLEPTAPARKAKTARGDRPKTQGAKKRGQDRD
jgi:FkbM family methyltransferase